MQVLLGSRGAVLADLCSLRQCISWVFIKNGNAQNGINLLEVISTEAPLVEDDYKHSSVQWYFNYFTNIWQ